MQILASPCPSSGLARKGPHQPPAVPAADCSFRAIHTATGTLWSVLGQEQGALLGTLMPGASCQPSCWLMVQSSQEPKWIRQQSSPHIVILPKGQGWLNSAVGRNGTPTASSASHFSISLSLQGCPFPGWWIYVSSCSVSLCQDNCTDLTDSLLIHAAIIKRRGRPPCYCSQEWMLKVFLICATTTGKL